LIGFPALYNVSVATGNAHIGVGFRSCVKFGAGPEPDDFPSEDDVSDDEKLEDTR